MTALHQNTIDRLDVAMSNAAARDEVQDLLEQIKGGNGALPAAITPYVTVEERGDAAMHQTILTVTNLPIATVDAGAAGAHGTAKIYDFPEGHIKIHGGHMNLTSIAAGAGGVIDAGVLDVGVGSASTSAADETLASTEQNIVTKKDVTLSGGTVANQSSINSTDTTIDGSGGAIDAYLNVAVENTSSTANDTITVNGTITLTWSNLGDN